MAAGPAEMRWYCTECLKPAYVNEFQTGYRAQGADQSEKERVGRIICLCLSKAPQNKYCCLIFAPHRFADVCPRRGQTHSKQPTCYALQRHLAP